MAATQGGKTFPVYAHKATIVANRSHGQFLQRLDSYCFF